MRGCTFFFGSRLALAFLSVTLLATGSWAAVHEKVLHNFGSGNNGWYPNGVIWDAAGNLYGTTSGAGIYQGGTVFELTPRDGGWSEKTLHSFGHGTDGVAPVSGLVMDGAGNLYGTTLLGGIHGLGIAFKVSPNGDGTWSEKVLHSFGNGNDASYVQAGLVLDAAGNLYGTSESGGIHEVGAVFELSPNLDGSWTERVLHSFGNGNDGGFPVAGLIFDNAGNLYSTTLGGGIHYAGTVFEMTPNQNGGWSEKVLHSFGNGNDAAEPEAGLILDSAGNLYGTAGDGGSDGQGAVFELSPAGDGSWSEKVLHNFRNNGTDGTFPTADLIMDTAGNLYSTTYDGGLHGQGMVFELTPNADGGWTEKSLHSFGGGNDGSRTYAPVVIDAAGNVYGTTEYGGVYTVGVLFEITP
jgi:uncharacterized repeat protein (TIGR03803 family)